MSWSVSTSGPKAAVADAVNAEHQRGHMPDSHRAAVMAELDQCDAEKVSLSAYGSRKNPPTGGNLSITLTQIS